MQMDQSYFNFSLEGMFFTFFILIHHGIAKTPGEILQKLNNICLPVYFKLVQIYNIEL